MSTRRGKGEGALFKNEARGVWEARIELPPGPNGERRRKVIRRKDKAALLAEVTKARKQLERAGDLPTASLTVAEFLDYWMREVAAKDRRPKTIGSYKSNLNWVRAAIGNTRLDRVSPASVRKVFTLMASEGLSSTYMRNVHSVMSAAFGDAEREGRIPRNPVELVKAPLKSVTDLEALTPADAVKLITAFGESPDTVLWATFLLTGARRGEVLGLEWDRVTDELDLSWQLQRIGKGQAVPANFERRQIEGGLWWTRPKTRAGWRIIPLVDPLRAILTAWQSVAPPNPWGLVFTRPDRHGAPLPIDPDYATQIWPSVLEAAGIDGHVRLHDLRHTTVDLLYAADISEDLIQQIVGHSSRAMSRAYRSKGNQDRVLAAMKQLSASLGFE